METATMPRSKTSRLVTIPVTVRHPANGPRGYYFGAELREARQRNNLTVLNASAAIGVDPSFLSRLETGDRGVGFASVGIISAMEIVYDVNIPLPAE